jgi:hypothetical protein
MTVIAATVTIEGVQLDQQEVLALRLALAHTIRDLEKKDPWMFEGKSRFHKVLNLLEHGDVNHTPVRDADFLRRKATAEAEAAAAAARAPDELAALAASGIKIVKTDRDGRPLDVEMQLFVTRLELESWEREYQQTHGREDDYG